MPNNIAVSITADVTDLQAKRAILSQELNIARADLRSFAKEAATSGQTAELKTSMLASADAVAKLENQVRANIVAQKAAVASSATETAAVEVNTAAHVNNRAAREALVLVHEAMSGNYRRLAGSAMIEAQALGLSTAATLGLGAAISLGAMELLPFIERLFKTSDALDKVKSSADQAADAMKKVWDSLDHSSPITEAATKAATALYEAQHRLAMSQHEMVDAQAALDASRFAGPDAMQAASARVLAVQTQIDQAKKDIQAAKADIDNLRNVAQPVQAMQERAQEREKKPKEDHSGLFGREINESEAETIARQAGFRVTSGFRTRDEQQYLYDHDRTAQNPVAKPGTSAHERGDALDIAFGPGVTPESIKSAFEKEGVHLTKLLKETGHFHIEWSTSGADKAAREADRQAKEQQREAERAAKERAQQTRQMSTSDISTDLKIKRDDIGARRQSVQSSFDAGTIDPAMKQALFQQLAQEEAQAEIEAQEKKKVAYAGDVVAVHDAANEERVIRANLAEQLAQIEREHTQEVVREARQQAEIKKELARQELEEKRRTISQIEGYENQLVSGILSGRRSLGQILGQLAQNMVEQEIQSDLHYLTEHRMFTTEQLASDRAASQGGILLHLFGERQKAAATIAGTEQQVAATSVGAAQKARIVGLSNLKEVTSHAATGAAAAYHAMAGIPVVGPILGAAAAVATFAAIEAFGTLASFDKGTNALPVDMPAMVHRGERIVPAADNQRLIALTERGAGANDNSRGGGVHAHFSPTINAYQQPNLKSLLANGHSDMVAWMQQARRMGQI